MVWLPWCTIILNDCGNNGKINRIFCIFMMCEEYFPIGIRKKCLDSTAKEQSAFQSMMIWPITMLRPFFSFQAVFNQMFFTEWMFLLARSCHFSDGKTGYLHFLQRTVDKILIFDPIIEGRYNDMRKQGWYWIMVCSFF